jgi:hypothetical protein
MRGKPLMTTFSFQRQPVCILPQQMNCTFTAKKLQETVIGQIASKPPAGFGPIMIKFAEVFIIPVLQKDTTFIIGMNHINLAFALCFCSCRLKTILTNIGHAHVYADMTSHFFDEINFLGLQDYLAIFLAAGTALAALMKDRPQSIFIDMFFCHFPVLL